MILASTAIKYTVAGIAVVAVPIVVAVAETEQFSWTALGTGLAVAFIAFMQVYQSWRATKRDQKIAEVTETVDKVHILTNNAMTLQKKSLAEVTAAKAAITKNALDIQAADAASKDYLEHIGRLAHEVEIKAKP